MYITEKKRGKKKKKENKKTRTRKVANDLAHQNTSGYIFFLYALALFGCLYKLEFKFFFSFIFEEISFFFVEIT